jgi:hypothetical protein
MNGNVKFGNEGLDCFVKVAKEEDGDYGDGLLLCFGLMDDGLYYAMWAQNWFGLMT